MKFHRNVRALRALALLVGTGLPPAMQAQVQFSCTFADSPTGCGFFEQYKGMDLVPPGPGRASIVGVGRDGLTGVRLHTEPGDDEVAGSGDAERNDLMLTQELTDGYEGREQWWAHSILFPDDYVDPPMSTGSEWHWGGVFGFHNTASGPGQGNFTLDAMPANAITPDRPTGLRFRGYGGANNGDGEFIAPVGPVVRNTWFDFVYHVRWSSGADGFFSAWVNGVKKLSHQGPTLYAGQGVYLKPANYHSAFGQPSSVIHDRVIRGSSPADVSPIPVPRFEELSAQVSGSPGWAWVLRGPEIAAFSGGTAGTTDVAGATAVFTFTGSAVSWIGLKCNVCGIAQVSIDGGPPIAVDTAGTAVPGSPGFGPQAVFSASNFAPGPHTLVITVTGTTTSGGAHIAVDAFDVLP